MHIVPAVVCGIAGFLAAIPLQTIIARSPAHESLRRPGIHCANCGTAAAGKRRISVVAMATRSNACTQCTKPLWPSWPWLELTTAAVLALAGFRLGWAWVLPAYLVFFVALVGITVVDLRYYLIPNRILYPALWVSMGWLILTALVQSDGIRLRDAFIGMASAWLFFFIVHVVSPRGMGYGDVRLAGLIGLLAGWVGLGNVVQAILLGLVIGATTGVLLMVVRVRGRRDAIPFGPFLAVGAAIAILFGADIANLWVPPE